MKLCPCLTEGNSDNTLEGRINENLLQHKIVTMFNICKAMFSFWWANGLMLDRKVFVLNFDNSLLEITFNTDF